MAKKTNKPNILREFYDRDGEISGVQPHEIRQDFNENFVNWLGDTPSQAFIDQTLHLDNILRREELNALVTGKAVMGPNLAFHCSMMIPRNVMRQQSFLNSWHQNNSKARTSRPRTIEISTEIFQKKRAELIGDKLAQVVYTASNDNSAPGALYEAVLARLEEFAAWSEVSLDTDEMANNFASVLGIDLDDIRYEPTGNYTPADRQAICHNLAEMLARGDDEVYQQILNHAERHFSVGENQSYETLGSLCRFIREYTPLSKGGKLSVRNQKDFAKHLSIPERTIHDIESELIPEFPFEFSMKLANAYAPAPEQRNIFLALFSGEDPNLPTPALSPRSAKPSEQEEGWKDIYEMETGRRQRLSEQLGKLRSVAETQEGFVQNRRAKRAERLKASPDRKQQAEGRGIARQLERERAQKAKQDALLERLEKERITQQEAIAWLSEPVQPTDTLQLYFSNLAIAWGMTEKSLSLSLGFPGWAISHWKNENEKGPPPTQRDILYREIENKFGEKARNKLNELYALQKEKKQLTAAEWLEQPHQDNLTMYFNRLVEVTGRSLQVIGQEAGLDEKALTHWRTQLRSSDIEPLCAWVRTHVSEAASSALRGLLQPHMARLVAREREYHEKIRFREEREERARSRAERDAAFREAELERQKTQNAARHILTKEPESIQETTDFIDLVCLEKGVSYQGLSELMGLNSQIVYTWHKGMVPERENLALFRQHIQQWYGDPALARLDALYAPKLAALTARRAEHLHALRARVRHVTKYLEGDAEQAKELLSGPLPDEPTLRGFLTNVCIALRILPSQLPKGYNAIFSDTLPPDTAFNELFAHIKKSLGPEIAYNFTATHIHQAAGRRSLMPPPFWQEQLRQTNHPDSPEELRPEWAKTQNVSPLRFKGGYVRAARRMLGISQSDVADALKISVADYKMFEIGRYHLTDQQEQIAGFFMKADKATAEISTTYPNFMPEVYKDLSPTKRTVGKALRLARGPIKRRWVTGEPGQSRRDIALEVVRVKKESASTPAMAWLSAPVTAELMQDDHYSLLELYKNFETISGLTRVQLSTEFGLSRDYLDNTLHTGKLPDVTVIQGMKNWASTFLKQSAKDDAWPAVEATIDAVLIREWFSARDNGKKPVPQSLPPSYHRARLRRAQEENHQDTEPGWLALTPPIDTVRDYMQTVRLAYGKDVLQFAYLCGLPYTVYKTFETATTQQDFRPFMGNLQKGITRMQLQLARAGQPVVLQPACITEWRDTLQDNPAQILTFSHEKDSSTNPFVKGTGDVTPEIAHHWLTKIPPTTDDNFQLIIDLMLIADGRDEHEIEKTYGLPHNQFLIWCQTENLVPTDTYPAIYRFASERFGEEAAQKLTWIIIHSSMEMYHDNPSFLARALPYHYYAAQIAMAHDPEWQKKPTAPIWKDLVQPLDSVEKYIRAARAAHGITQEEFAELCDLKLIQYKTFENTGYGFTRVRDRVTRGLNKLAKNNPLPYLPSAFNFDPFVDKKKRYNRAPQLPAEAQESLNSMLAGETSPDSVRHLILTICDANKISAKEFSRRCGIVLESDSRAVIPTDIETLRIGLNSLYPDNSALVNQCIIIARTIVEQEESNKRNVEALIQTDAQTWLAAVAAGTQPAISYHEIVSNVIKANQLTVGGFAAHCGISLNQAHLWLKGSVPRRPKTLRTGLERLYKDGAFIDGIIAVAKEICDTRHHYNVSARIDDFLNDSTGEADELPPPLSEVREDNLSLALLHPKSPKTLGDKMEYYRISRGKTIEELAELSGITVQTIKTYENNEKLTVDATLFKLWDALGLSGPERDDVIQAVIKAPPGSFGSKFHYYRLRSNKTQGETATELGVAQGTVFTYDQLKKNRPVDPIVLPKIKTAFTLTDAEYDDLVYRAIPSEFSGLGKELVFHRMRSGQIKGTLAKNLDIPTSAITHYEANTQIPDEEYISRFCQKVPGADSTRLLTVRLEEMARQESGLQKDKGGRGTLADRVTKQRQSSPKRGLTDF